MSERFAEGEPSSSEAPLFEDAKVLEATAWLVGERIELRGFDPSRVIATSPLTLRAGVRGLAFVYRYGAVVFFELSDAEQRDFIDSIADGIERRFATPESDDAEIRVEPGKKGRVAADGSVVLSAASLQRVQVVSHILARSALLAHYEAELGAALERIEPVAERMRSAGRSGLGARHLIRQIGEGLLTEMRVVGRAEVTEKPELTWDDPELDRLYARLADEYELQERDRAVSRKLELLGRTAGSLLEILHSQRSLRVEWYIVILILVEIVILIYDLYIRA